MERLERWQKALRVALERTTNEVPDWARAKAGEYRAPALVYWAWFGDVETLQSWPDIRRIVDIIELIEAELGVEHVVVRRERGGRL